MRSTLETIDGRYDHAVFTTYSINLHFFEQWVLPLLRQAEVRNVVVFADEAQLGAALEDRSLRAVGRSYHVVSTRLGRGAFHPKLMLLSSENGSRLCVSSANLTVDGQLRNVEAGIVLETNITSHAAAVADAAAFFRRLSEHAPTPTAEALLAALEPITPSEETGPVRFVHNLDRPLIGQFPDGEFTAVTPFADEGAAARELSSRGGLTVITDGAHFAAASRFFDGDWTVEPREFKHRRLHGKAYWSDTPEGGWLLIGSPNLSRPALLQTAAEANTEVAIILTPHQPRLPDVPGEPWTLGSLSELAPRRHAAEQQSTQQSQLPSAFNAWEEEEAIATSGIPDGSSIEYWDTGAWRPVGITLNNRIGVGAELRPYLIRAQVSELVWRQAVVHRPGQLLRQRVRPRTTSRAADVVSELPLDLEGVKTLEGVLTDLYVLAQLEGEERLSVRLRESPTTTPGEDETIGDWRPARPDDEPRVPDIYRQAWKGEPDALLALIRSALRLDRADQQAEREISDELLELGELGAEPEPSPTPPPDRPAVQRPVLTRYRNSLVKLLERGADFVRAVDSPALASLGFLTVLRLHEQLATLEVEVDGEPQTLVLPDVLLTQKLDLLSSYLVERSGRDAECLATARIHLAECLDQRAPWEPLEWETLEALAYAVSPVILASREHVNEAAEGAGVDPASATARLRPYADRADWTGFFAAAEQELDDLDFADDPFPWVSGGDWYDEDAVSPAWRLAGYGAIVGYKTRTPYAVIALNDNTHSKHLAHALVVDPAHQTVLEAMQRRSDGAWLARTYKPVTQGTAGRMFQINSEALADTTRSSYTDLGPETHALLHKLLSGQPPQA